jgi:outer membrane protein OmpA-like peptidoglycan-associated protein
MRTKVLILSILLIFWITGSSYWYVCRVRGDCKNSPGTIENMSPETQGVQSGYGQADEKSALAASVEQAKNFLVSSGTQKVYFEISSATADMSAVPEEYLNKLKFYTGHKPEAKINVTGHTDNTGSVKFNNELGSLRAEFVKSFLINYGISAEKIQTSSKSFNEPAAPNNTSEGRARNRRTEINVLI